MSSDNTNDRNITRKRSSRPDAESSSARGHSEGNLYSSKLSDNLQCFRDIFDCVSDAIFVSDPETGATLEANQRMCELLGYSVEELRSIDIGVFSPGTPPYTLSHALDYIKKAAAGEPQAFEWQAKHRSGRLFWTDVIMRSAEIAGQSVVLTVARDITEHKRAEDALRDSESRFHGTFDNAGAGMALVSLEGRFIQVNRAFCQLLDLTEEELLGMTVGAVTHPDDRQSSQDVMRDMLAGGPLIQRLEKRYIRRDGRELWGEVSVSLVRDAQNKPDYFVALVSDITRRKHAEEKMLEANLEAERYFHLVPDLVCVASVDGHFIKLNHAWEEALGYSEAELLRMPFFELIHPDDLENTREQVRRQIAGEQVTDFVNRYRCKDGSYRWLAWKSTAVSADNLLYAAARDVTEHVKANEALQESEANYRLLFENMTSAFALHEMIYDETGQPVDYRYLEANPAFEKLTGLSVEKLLGRTLKELMPNTEQYWIDLFGKVAMTGEPVAYQNYSREIGRYYDVYAFSPEKDRFAVVFSDITDRKRTEEEKRTLEHNLEEHKRHFYRETIMSVTDGKLSICEELELEPYIAGATVCVDVRTASDVGNARVQVEQLCREFGLNEEELGAFAIGVGEAITNALKHASGGKAYAGKTASEVWVTVVDSGPGIESLVLPGAVLRRGFSTKPSMGLGYSIMMDVADRILLKTDPDGTAVVLIKTLVDVAISLDRIPDTWESLGF